MGGGVFDEMFSSAKAALGVAETTTTLPTLSAAPVAPVAAPLVDSLSTPQNVSTRNSMSSLKPKLQMGGRRKKGTKRGRRGPSRRGRRASKTSRR